MKNGSKWLFYNKHLAILVKNGLEGVSANHGVVDSLVHFFVNFADNSSKVVHEKINKNTGALFGTANLHIISSHNVQTERDLLDAGDCIKNPLMAVINYNVDRLIEAFQGALLK